MPPADSSLACLAVRYGECFRGQELLFAWPQDPWSLQQLASRANIVLPALGLGDIPLDTPLHQLSDGYKRRCALAVALVRRHAPGSMP
jgi:energy-coupling factor transporter ATP-binding protein EcfA2